MSDSRQQIYATPDALPEITDPIGLGFGPNVASFDWTSKGPIQMNFSLQGLGGYASYTAPAIAIIEYFDPWINAIVRDTRVIGGSQGPTNISVITGGSWDGSTLGTGVVKIAIHNIGGSLFSVLDFFNDKLGRIGRILDIAGTITDTFDAFNVNTGFAVQSMGGALVNNTAPNIAEAMLRSLDGKTIVKRLGPVAPECFLAGTPVLMTDGTRMPIEQIRPGDRVTAFDPAADGGRGANVSRRVTQTFQNEARQIVDLRGLLCTLGHVFLTGETDIHGRGIFKTIAAILKDDGTLVDEEGSVLRARTGAKVGSIEDTPVHITYRDCETGAECVVLVRAGVPAVTVHRLAEAGGWDHQRWSLAQWSAKSGVDVLIDGTLRSADGTIYGASDWPEGSTPFDDRESQNWIIRMTDGEFYTPPWIADLTDVDERAGLRIVGEAPLSIGRS